MCLLMPVPILVAVTAGLVGVLVAGRRLFPGTVTAKRAFRCPFRDTNVDVDFKEAVWDGSLVDVTVCSAFSPPQDVRCEKGCLMLGKFPAPKELTTHRGSRGHPLRFPRRLDRSSLHFVCSALVPDRQHWTRGQLHHLLGHTAQEDVL